MSDYRRNYVPGATYFFTVVTHARERFLTGERARFCLREAILRVKKKRPFKLVASVLLPDHLHMVWTLPPGDADYPTRWAQIKEDFTRRWRLGSGSGVDPCYGRIDRRERAIWQRRYWEYTCRDDDDLRRCVDYVHWNPVKHGQVASVVDYEWSSFHRFVRAGEYDPGWGRSSEFPGMIGPGWE